MRKRVGACGVSMPTILAGGRQPWRGNPQQALEILARPAQAIAQRCASPASRERSMKELSLDEVLRIAGGVPVPAALDEITYRAPTDPDPARLLPGRIQQPHSCEE